MSLTIWADADSLPRQVREIVAKRTAREASRIRAVFVSARPVGNPSDGALHVVTGAMRHDGDLPVSADDYIVDHAHSGDIIITRDIPLASRALESGMYALNDRGDEWTASTIGERLSIRDGMAAIRSLGLAPMPRGRSFGPREVKAFADAFDRALTRIMGNQA